MKNIIVISLCLCTVIVTLLLREGVYDITSFEPGAMKQMSSDKGIESHLTVHFHQRRPFYERDKGKVRGLIAEPINLIFKQSDISFSWTDTPAQRQLEIIRKNDSPACAAGWFKTPAREKFGKYSLPLYQDKPFVAVARADNSLLQKDEEELARVLGEDRLRLLVKKGYSYGSYIDSLIASHSPWTISTTTNNKGMLMMIQTHRADYCFMTQEEAYDLLLFSGLNRADFKTIFFSDIPPGSMRYLFCSKKVKDEDLARLNGAITHFLRLPVKEK